MRRMILYCRAALLLSGLVAAVSCSKERNIGEEAAASEEAVLFGIDTRTLPDPSTTFRVLLYETSGNHLYRFHTTGTAAANTGRGWGTYYYDNEEIHDTPVLTPCEVDDKGTFLKEGTVEEYGINGQSQAHYVAYISPGFIHNADGTVDVNPNETFFATGAQKKSLGGYGVVKIDSALVDRRARVGFRIYNGLPKGSEFTMTDAKIQGAGGDGTPDNPETVTYHPCTQQVLENDTRRSIELTPISQNMEGYADGLRYQSEKDKYEYVIASIYARKDIVSELLHEWYKDYHTGNFIESDYLYFRCKLKVGNGEVADVLLPLTTRMPVLRPMHTYIFNITVKSEYMEFSVDIYNHDKANAWEDVAPGDITVDKPDAVVSLGTFHYGQNEGNDWESVDNEDQTIG